MEKRERTKRNGEFKIIKRKKNSPERLSEQDIVLDLNKHLRTQSLVGIIAALLWLIPMGVIFVAVSSHGEEPFLMLGTTIVWSVPFVVFLFIGISQRKKMLALMDKIQNDGIIIDKDICTEKFMVKRFYKSAKSRDTREYYLRFGRYDSYQVQKSEYDKTTEGEAFCISMAEPGSPCVAYREAAWDFSGLSFDSRNRHIYIRREL